MAREMPVRARGPVAGTGRLGAAFLLKLFSAAVLALGMAAGTPGLAETRSGEVQGYRYRLFVPDGGSPDSARPLVVVLHGCRQSAAEIARLTRFDDLAPASAFAVLYPETRPSADNPYGCWRWWAPESQGRRGGEAEIIVAMVSEAIAAMDLDRQRVYAVGFSSGGAMSAILGALYPDIFAAVGVHSGMPYAAASTGPCALRAMSEGAVKAEARARIAYHTQGRAHRVMPLLVIQGTADDVVARANAGLLIRQFARLNDLADDGDGQNQSIDAVADSETEQRAAGVRRHRIRGYQDAGGKEIMREIAVEGMAHAWSGGSAQENFADPKGPDASSIFWEFLSRWSLDRLPFRTGAVSSCRERFGSNFTHYWWFDRMSREEYRCDPWGWTWRREYEGEWTEGRCP